MASHLNRQTTNLIGDSVFLLTLVADVTAKILVNGSKWKLLRVIEQTSNGTSQGAETGRLPEATSSQSISKMRQIIPEVKICNIQTVNRLGYCLITHVKKAERRWST